jgi:hypothetical protein
VRHTGRFGTIVREIFFTIIEFIRFIDRCDLRNLRKELHSMFDRIAIFCFAAFSVFLVSSQATAQDAPESQAAVEPA